MSVMTYGEMNGGEITDDVFSKRSEILNEPFVFYLDLPKILSYHAKSRVEIYRYFLLE